MCVFVGKRVRVFGHVRMGVQVCEFFGNREKGILNVVRSKNICCSNSCILIRNLAPVRTRIGVAAQRSEGQPKQKRTRFLIFSQSYLQIPGGNFKSYLVENDFMWIRLVLGAAS